MEKSPETAFIQYWSHFKWNSFEWTGSCCRQSEEESSVGFTDRRVPGYKYQLLQTCGVFLSLDRKSCSAVQRGNVYFDDVMRVSNLFLFKSFLSEIVKVILWPNSAKMTIPKGLIYAAGFRTKRSKWPLIAQSVLLGLLLCSTALCSHMSFFPNLQ